MTNLRTLLAVLSILSALLLGCSDDGADDTSDKGSAPTITDVTLDKTAIAVGSIETVNITVAYSDADGDVSKLGEQIVTPSGTSRTPNFVELVEAAGQKEGTQAFMLQIAAPAAGDATISFRLVDQQGNESEKVTRTITAK